MRNQSHYTETFTEPQVLFSMILEKVTDLYKKYVPSFVQNRRNVSLQKQSDTVIIACFMDFDAGLQKSNCCLPCNPQSFIQ